MTKTLVTVPVERVERAILLIRGEKVILDADLAVLYGVSTKRLKEQVRRNRQRFPYLASRRLWIKSFWTMKLALGLPGITRIRFGSRGLATLTRLP